MLLFGYRSEECVMLMGIAVFFVLLVLISCAGLCVTIYLRSDALREARSNSEIFVRHMETVTEAAYNWRMRTARIDPRDTEALCMLRFAFNAYYGASVVDEVLRCTPVRERMLC